MTDMIATLPPVSAMMRECGLEPKKQFGQNFLFDLNLTGRHILIVEDILDSGNTLYFLKEMLESRGAASVRLCTFMQKPARLKKPITPDYNGFVIPDEFVVGYGLDYGQLYRNLKYVGVLDESVYS